jgi:hypothetical protein
VRHYCSSALALALVGAACVAPAAAATTIASGALVHGTFQTPLNTKSAYVGQPFSISVVPPYPNDSSALRGAVIHGHVAVVQKAGRGTNAGLELAADKVTTSAGRSTPVSLRMTGSNAPAPAKQPGRVLAGTVGGMGRASRCGSVRR